MAAARRASSIMLFRSLSIMPRFALDICKCVMAIDFNGIKYMGTEETRFPGACLTCGGDVISRNRGKNGVCAKCGPVAFDVARRNGQHVEGFSASALARDPGEYRRSKGAPFNGARGGHRRSLARTAFAIG